VKTDARQREENAEYHSYNICIFLIEKLWEDVQNIKIILSQV
jgi:hypothetical protein